MPALIECVPNFSEGRDPEVIRRITARIESVEGATLLHVDPGKATNRTVVTFAGEPDAVVEAAFRAIAEAAELIDMRRHTGEHPRMGATDVCPLIPISGITMDETAEYASRLAERVGRELGLPVYLYEAA
jgi:glutamate formiminotransferase/formiminotetrahydrofolate cyclodeaminase